MVDKERGSGQGWSDLGETVKDGQKPERWSGGEDSWAMGVERSSDRGKAARDIRNDHRTEKRGSPSVKARDGQMVVNWQLGSGVGGGQERW